MFEDKAAVVGMGVAGLGVVSGSEEALILRGGRDSSRIVYSNPASSKAMAAERPAIPAPTMRTLRSVVAMVSRSRRRRGAEGAECLERVACVCSLVAKY